MNTTTDHLERARLLATRLYAVLRSREDCHPSHSAADCLERAEAYLARRGDNGYFGYEGHLESDDCRGDKMNCLYLNTGDSYEETLLWDGRSEEFVITSYGDWVEQAEAEALENDGETRCGYCGEMTPCDPEYWQETYCESCGRNVQTGEPDNRPRCECCREPHEDLEDIDGESLCPDCRPDCQ